MEMALDKILEKSCKEQELSEKEVRFLMELSEKEDIHKVFEAARTLRKRYFGDKVFLYGFVYFSTYCRNECSFCFYRRSNDKPPRYRKTVEEIVITAKKLKESGIHLIDLTMGEDPYYIQYPQRLIEIVRTVKAETNLPVMISPGVIPNEVIDMLVDAGADWFALYQETHNRQRFNRLRMNQDYNTRFDAKKYALKKGMLIEEGLLVGKGNSAPDALESFNAMKKLRVSQVRAMTFIPQEGTPMEHCHKSSFLNEQLIIAVMRLIFPQLLIPASLDVDGLKGLEERLNAGANVVTSIIPPDDGYAGVANAQSDIREGYRTIEGIQEALKRCGLKNAAADEYRRWMVIQKSLLKKVMG